MKNSSKLPLYLFRLKHLIITKFDQLFYRADIILCSKLKVYLSSSGGRPKDRANLALGAAFATPIILNELYNKLEHTQTAKEEIITVEKFFELQNGLKENLDHLQKLLASYGSDKSTYHNYHYVYSSIVKPDSVSQFFEIGLGTNNVDVISNMGPMGKPGASLRGFRDYIKNGHVYGADIDKRVLFKEDKIDTFFIDQLDTSSFEDIKSKLKHKVDIFIDDGLHAPDANLNSLMLGMDLVRSGGWIVIEDIPERSVVIWQLVRKMIGDRAQCWICKARNSYMFVVKAA